MTPSDAAGGDASPGWLLVRNRDAGSDDAERVTALAAALDDAEVAVTADEDELDAALAAADGRTIVVCGGDGSVQLAVERARALELLDDLVFGVLPLGTGNDLAGHHGLPADPEEAAALLRTHVARPFDVLLTDDDHLVVNAVHVGIGVQAAERAGELKESFGALAYPLGALVAGVAAEGLDVEVHLDGDRIDLGEPALMVVVSNGSTIGGGTPVAPDAEPDDGLLDVAVVHAVGPAARVAFATQLLRGTHLDRDDVVHGRGREVRIVGRSLAHNRDGELEQRREGERTYRVLPSAWRLHV